MHKGPIKVDDFNDFNPTTIILSSKTISGDLKIMQSVSFLEGNYIEFHVYLNSGYIQEFDNLQSALDLYNEL